MESEETSNSSATITEYIYEDEILPEIEIRQTVSIDTFLNDNPRFVSLSKENIFTLLTQFFSTSKSQGFLDLHSKIIEDKSISINNHVFVHVDAHRKNFEDISKWLNAYKDAQKAPSFELKEIEIAKLSYPFDKETVSNDKQCILDEPFVIVLSTSEKIDISKILLKDTVATIELPILGIYWKIYTPTVYSYTHELITSNPYKYIEWNLKRPCDDFKKWLLKYVQPTFEDTIASIKNITSFHEYTTILYQNGYDIYNLTRKQHKLLQNYLEEKTISDKEDKEHPASNSNKYPKVENTFPLLTFLETINKYYELQTHLQDDKLYKFQSLIGSYIASLANFQNDTPSFDPYTLLTQIINNTRSIEEIQTDITQLRNKDNYKKADTLLKTISSSKTYVKLEKIIELYAKISNSIIDDFPSPYIDAYNDINDFKMGNDISKYDGTPKTAQDITYQETQYEEFIDPLDDTTELNAEEEGIDSIPDSYGTDFPSLTEVHDGVKEIFLFILPYLIKLQTASGISWDINIWIRSYSTEMQVKSRANSIKEFLPEINSVILQRICSNSLDISMEIINDLNTAELSSKLRNIYPKIYGDWQNNCKNAYYDALTTYILDSFDASVRGTLDFSIFNGMLSFADLWSPYGFPLDDKKTSAGIFYYISAIAGTQFPFTDTKTTQSNIIEERILAIATNKYALRLQKLKELWLKQKPTVKQDAATQAKEELINITKRLLAKEKINFMPTYVKAYYYLPTFIPKKDLVAFKKQPVWAQGCCLTTLDKKYVADNDWKEHVKPLWNMKKKLAEERWLTSQRSELTLFKNKKVKSSPPSYFKPEIVSDFYIKQPCLSEVKEPDVKISFEPNDNWIQKSHYEIVEKNARDGAFQLATQCINLAYKTRGKTEKILASIAALSQLSDIQHILLRILQNINIKLDTYTKTSNEYKFLESSLMILHDMKNILCHFTQARGNEYIECVYKSRYFLARALCLPGIPENNKLIKPDNVAASFYENILQENYNILTKWTTANTMLTQEEIQTYITKMREEQKKVTLNKLDTLNVDDIQLMKDMKRIGLMKVIESLEQSEQDNVQTPTEDQDGESEWLQETTDPEQNDDDTLSSIL
jgi:hypothetical protein